ncbi:MAG: ATP-binding protein [Planctomycetota bacterium]
MLRSRLFWKLFLGFTLVNLLTGAALVSATWSWQADNARRVAEERLSRDADRLTEAALAWVESPNTSTAAALKQLAAETGIRARVRRSTDDESLSVGTIESPRSGELLRTTRSLEVNGEVVGDLRVERSAARVSTSTAALWLAYLKYAPLVGLLIALASYALVIHLVGPVRSLTEAAAAMAAGDYRQRAFVANRDELGTLAKSFNAMSAELGQRLNELQESDRRQATVLGGMIEGVVAMDERQHVLFANAAAGKLFGFTPGEVVGRPLLEVVRNHPLHLAATAAIDAQTPQRLEVDWEQRVLSVQVTPLVGQPAGAIIVLHDTTELRRLETLRRDFVANVSHELKTPLSTIKANAETLLRGAVDDKEHRTKFLSGIGEQSERLEDLIHDMLNLARIESAQQPYEIDTVSVADAVRSCLQDYAPRAEAKRIDLAAADANGSAGALVRADRKGLRVILGNLVDNAIKYTPEDGEVRVRWHAAQHGQATMVEIEVADTGYGIPEEKLTRVFERFFRVDEARSRELGGTGLGLSIVKHLAQSFGGEVSVKNQPDHGAVFTVTLPAA